MTRAAQACPPHARFVALHPARGYALIAVLGILAILGLLATAFVNLATSERQTSESHLMLVRARMAAQSGIEFAVAEMRTTRAEADEFGTSPLARRQAWSDIRDTWIYGDGVSAPLGPRPFGAASPSLRESRRPSFAAGRAGGSMVSGPQFTGDRRDGEFFTLRVIDCAAQIHVNDRNESLERILDHLGALLNVGALGRTILAARPASGYADENDLLQRALRGDRRLLARVRDFVTCFAWTDSSTVAWSRTAPRWRPEARSPVNVNTASTEVLTAILWGLQAEYPVRDAAGRIHLASVGPLGRETAQRLAEHIAAQRVRFGEGRYAFNDWMHFSTEVVDTAGFLSQPEKDLVKANLNPNSDLRKLNPDRILAEPNPDTPSSAWTGIDKSDVTVGSTEACFGSMGYYEISSLGRVVADGRVVAEHEIDTVCRLFDVLRATTQCDFETDREWTDPHFGSLVSEDGCPAVVSGPEYPYAASGSYRSRGVPIAAAGDAIGMREGEEVRTWAASYDGSLQLSGLMRKKATVWPPERSSIMLGFNRGNLRPDLSPVADGPRDFLEPAGARQGLAPVRVVAGVTGGPRDTQNFFADGSDLHPSGLYIDGAERGRVKTLPANNLPGARGSIEFLVKPAVDFATAVGETTLVQWSNGGSFNYAEMRVYAAHGRVFAEWRTAGNGLPVPTERRATFGTADWLPHTWHHVEVSWDEESTRLFLDGSPGEAPAMATPAVAPAFACIQALPPWFILGGRVVVDWIPAREIPPAVMIGDLGKNLETIRDRLVRGVTTRVEAAATFDNVCVHPYPQHRAAFIPQSRYHDRSYREYTSAGTGPGGGSAAVGVYKKRLTAITQTASRESVVLGTVSCTHYHPYHEHAEGHDRTAGSFGHITPGVALEGNGGYRYYRAYDGGAGIPLGVPMRADQRASFLAEFEISDRLPVMESPILCDFTVTYMKRPAFLSWSVPTDN